jgi:cell division protein FtsA
VQPRVEEIISLCLEDIRQTGLEKMISGGVVLTGGTVLLEGMVDVAEQIFDLPVRVGIPGGVNNIGGALASPPYSTVIGLVLYGYRTHTQRWAKTAQNGNLLSRGATWLKSRLS